MTIENHTRDEIMLATLNNFTEPLMATGHVKQYFDGPAYLEILDQEPGLAILAELGTNPLMNGVHVLMPVDAMSKKYGKLMFVADTRRFLDDWLSDEGNRELVEDLELSDSDYHRQRVLDSWTMYWTGRIMEENDDLCDMRAFSEVNSFFVSIPDAVGYRFTDLVRDYFQLGIVNRTQPHSIYHGDLSMLIAGVIAYEGCVLAHNVSSDFNRVDATISLMKISHGVYANLEDTILMEALI